MLSVLSTASLSSFEIEPLLIRMRALSCVPVCVWVHRHSSFRAASKTFWNVQLEVAMPTIFMAIAGVMPVA